MTVTDIQSHAGYYDGGSGRIHYRSWSCDNPAWVVLFAHGFGDHSGRFGRYGETLAARGGAVFACDHRGHGMSDGERAVVDDFDVLAHDFLRLRAVPSMPAGVPTVFAGHSMGGLVVARAALLDAPGAAGLVLSGARLGRWDMGELVLAQIDRGESTPTAGQGHPLLDTRTVLPPDALSRDTTVVQQFAADSLTYRGTYPVPTLRATVRAEVQLEQAADGALGIPVLYMHGGADPVTPFRGSVQRLARLVADDLEVRIFPDARHSIYNEINRDEVYDVLVGFIGRVAGRA